MTNPEITEGPTQTGQAYENPTEMDPQNGELIVPRGNNEGTGRQVIGTDYNDPYSSEIWASQNGSMDVERAMYN
jgi:hypothetical protein